MGNSKKFALSFNALKEKDKVVLNWIDSLPQDSRGKKNFSEEICNALYYYIKKKKLDQKKRKRKTLKKTTKSNFKQSQKLENVEKTINSHPSSIGVQDFSLDDTKAQQAKETDLKVNDSASQKDEHISSAQTESLRSDEEKKSEINKEVVVPENTDTEGKKESDKEDDDNFFKNMSEEAIKTIQGVKFG